MNEDLRADRNRTMLAQCNAAFRTTLANLLASLQGLGYRPRIQCAWRDPAEELELYNSGKSHVRWGMHNATTADGKPDALAADVLDDDHPLNPTRPFLLALARGARARGLTTGIDWGLPVGPKAALQTLLAQQGGMWDGPLGWDPCHVEVTGVTYAQAMHGARPFSDTGGVIV